MLPTAAWKIVLLALLLLAVLGAVAQDAPAASPSAPAQGPPGDTGAPRPNEDTRNLERTAPSTLARGQSFAVVSGSVIPADGKPLPDDAVVESYCNGTIGDVARTRGRFRVRAGGSSQGAGFPGGALGQGFAGCEIRVTLSGYHPVTQPLDQLSPMGQDIGALVLKPLENVSGFTYSATSALAPKDATKAFDRALGHLRRNRLAAARGDLEKAVALHPQFAAALFELGTVQHRMQEVAKAKDSYRRSIAADEKYLKPYLQLAMIASADREWPEVSKLTEVVIERNPYEFPQAFLYHAVAAYNLKDLGVAEESVRRALELDAVHKLPKAFHLLGRIRLDLGDRSGAIENFDLYLKYAPGAPDAAQVKEEVRQLRGSGLN